MYQDMGALEDMRALIENGVLPRVVKPLRYVGNEYNVVKKDWNAVKLHTLFAFPDIYEIGMSHLGLRILYHLVNEEQDYLMERVFAPWTDMEKLMREKEIPLFSLESYRPLRDFDCIGFTLQYEMSFTNILNMLDLGQIPLKAEERGDGYPLIMAGGPCAFNPEPLAAYIDFFVLGEGEEVILEILAAITGHLQANGGRQKKAALLQELARIEGVYVPAFYETIRGKNGELREISVKETGAAPKIVKRVVKDLEQAYFPLRPIVPYLEIVHDRIMLEVLRGCTRGCRFCQAGMIYRPVRERSKELLERQAEGLLQSTGYDEISLTSLSTSDYTCVEPLIDTLLAKHQEERVGVSLPSLRVDSFSVNLAKQVQKVRKSGLTFAPEAGTQKLRDVINKGVTEENLLEVAEAAFQAGWLQIKLYFMIGLPAETFADLDGIADLAYKVLDKGLKIMREQGKNKQPRVTISVSSFVPKAHSPFQWEPQDPLELLEEKQRYLKGRLRDRRIVYNYHDAKLSHLEAVFARGGRELGPALRRAWELGCRFDSWSEHFRYETWMRAFSEVGLNTAEIANTQRERDDVLPWAHLDLGITKDFLWREREKAFELATTGDCRFEQCSVCGVCQDLDAAMLLRKGAR